MLGTDDPDAGRLRTRQSWIASRALPTPLDASYVPPPPEEVQDPVADLVAYINSYGAGSPLGVALAHVQFETIHPFVDGNGRTGRALMHLMLRRSGLTPGCTVPISSSLAMRRVEYVDALSRSHVACGVTDPERSAALVPWLGLMAESVIDAASYAERILSHISDVGDRWRAQAAAAGLRKSSAALRLIELLPAHPVLTMPQVMDLLGVKKHTALRSLDALQRAGILVQRSAGRRNRVFEAEAIMDAFAALASVRPGDSDIRLLSPASTGATARALGTAQAAGTRRSPE
ncbi:MAG: Fic family protein [Acidimicrobiaceae bacterium]|nr:Fic family protein [Acidimicrobiaceae bacterium]